MRTIIAEEVVPIEQMLTVIPALNALGWREEYWGDDEDLPFLRFISDAGDIIEVEMDGRTTLAVTDYPDCIEVTHQIVDALVEIRNCLS
jgi:hypothetical protein